MLKAVLKVAGPEKCNYRLATGYDPDREIRKLTIAIVQLTVAGALSAIVNSSSLETNRALLSARWSAVSVPYTEQLISVARGL